MIILYINGSKMPFFAALPARADGLLRHGRRRQQVSSKRKTKNRNGDLVIAFVPLFKAYLLRSIFA
jgi:hypothetical protein